MTTPRPSLFDLLRLADEARGLFTPTAKEEAPARKPVTPGEELGDLVAGLVAGLTKLRSVWPATSPGTSTGTAAAPGTAGRVGHLVTLDLADTDRLRLLAGMLGDTVDVGDLRAALALTAGDTTGDGGAGGQAALRAAALECDDLDRIASLPVSDLSDAELEKFRTSPLARLADGRGLVAAWLRSRADAA